MTKEKVHLVFCVILLRSSESRWIEWLLGVVPQANVACPSTQQSQKSTWPFLSPSLPDLFSWRMAYCNSLKSRQ